MKGFRVLMWIAVVLAVLVVGFFAIGPQRVWQVVAGDPDLGPTTLQTLTRTGKPNDALIAPAPSPGASSTLMVDAPAPIFMVDPDRLYNTLIARIDATGTVQWVEQDPEQRYARAITRSPLLRFPDTNNIWVLDAGEGRSTLALYAAAQLGYSDTGKNRERLDRWLALLDDLPRMQAP